MTNQTRVLLALLIPAACASAAHAQFSIPWSTIDGGGGRSAGGTFTLSGTIGQPDAGQSLSSGTFSTSGGFWSSRSTPTCPADFNQSGTLSVQDIFDFLNAWFANSPSADFNGGGISVQDVFDFLSAWFGGC